MRRLKRPDALSSTLGTKMRHRERRLWDFPAVRPPGGIAHRGEVASDRTNCRSPVAYYAILTNARITHMPRHVFAATNRPTKRAHATRTANNAPQPEQTTHRKDVTTGTLGGPTGQPPARFISSGHGGNRATGSLLTRARFALWDTAAAPPGGARTRCGEEAAR